MSSLEKGTVENSKIVQLTPEWYKGYSDQTMWMHETHPVLTQTWCTTGQDVLMDYERVCTPRETLVNVAQSVREWRMGVVSTTVDNH